MRTDGLPAHGLESTEKYWKLKRLKDWKSGSGTQVSENLQEKEKKFPRPLLNELRIKLNTLF